MSVDGGTPAGADPVEDHVPGEAGTWLFVLGEMTIFAVLFGAYIEARSHDPGLFDRGQAHLDQTFGAVNTLLLLVSSLLVVLGLRAFRAGSGRLARAFVVGGMACGAAFVASKAIEWGGHLGDDLTPQTDQFWTWYYTLTGLHLLHLLLGLALLAYVWRQVGDPDLRGRQVGYVEGSAAFWHMVDLLWIVLFPLLYLVK